MFFVAFGQCTVSYRDEKKKEHLHHRKLRYGDVFGEIAMIYECRRTATVQSLNYTTLAKLRPAMYKDLIGEYPQMNHFLKEHICKYNDNMKRFLRNSLQNIPYFQDLEELTYVDLTYHLEPVQMEQGQVLFRPDENADKLIFIVDGVVELYTYFEQNEFVLERLFRGSAINFRTFFMADLVHVYARCAKPSLLVQLSINKLNGTACTLTRRHYGGARGV